MQKSPFKFLDSFTKEDKDIFFGRDNEIEELYYKVFESKTLLVYGVSGTGKSSIIHCGLANKFDNREWFPISIRRGININDSFRKILSKVAITPVESLFGPGAEDMVNAIESVFLDYYKPIYFIFDQFEELFIFGTKDERIEFIKTVRAVTNSNVQCRFIFVIREEYLAGITEFEDDLPDVMLNRMRVENISKNKAAEVIDRLCNVSEIEIEEGFTEELLEKLKEENNKIELTYLQVFLDKIYQKASANENETIKFTKPMLENLGNVSDVLGNYLDEQIKKLEDPEVGTTILKSFVSLKGTKRQITEMEVKETSLSFGKDIPEQQIRDVIRKLISYRILKDKDESGRYELKHDALAAKIYEKITILEKELLEVRQYIENAYTTYKRKRIYLSSESLKYIEPYIAKLYLNAEQSKFFEESRYEIQKDKRRKKKILVSVLLLIMVISTSLTFWSMIERSKSEEQRMIAEKQKIILEQNEKKLSGSYFNSLSKDVLEYDPTQALRVAEHAYSLDPTNQEIYKNILSIYYNNQLYQAKDNPENLYLLDISKDETKYLWINYYLGDSYALITNNTGDTLTVFNRDSTDNKENYLTDAKFVKNDSLVLTLSNDNIFTYWDIKGNRLNKINQFYDSYKSFLFYEYLISPTLGEIYICESKKSDTLFTVRLEGIVKKIKPKIFNLSFFDFYSNSNLFLISDDHKYSHKTYIIDREGDVISNFRGYYKFGKFSNNRETNLKENEPEKILFVDYDNNIFIFDYHGNIINEIKNFKDNISDIWFSQNNDYIIIKTAKKYLFADFYGNVKNEFTNIQIGRAIRFLKNNSLLFTSTAPLQDLTYSSYNITKNLIWDLNRKREYYFQKLKNDTIKSSSFSSNGEFILTESKKGKIYMLDCNANSIKSFAGDSVKFLYNDNFIILSRDGKIAIYDITGKKLKTLVKSGVLKIKNFAVSPDRKTIGFIIDGYVLLYDYNGELLRYFGIASYWARNLNQLSNQKLIKDLQFSYDIKLSQHGKYSIIKNYYEYIDLRERNELYGFYDEEIVYSSDSILHLSIEIEQDYFNNSYINCDESKLICCTGTQAELWDLKNMSLPPDTLIIKESVDSLDLCSFSNNNEILLGTSPISLWNENGNFLKIFRNTENSTNGKILGIIKFSPDSKFIVFTTSKSVIERTVDYIDINIIDKETLKRITIPWGSQLKSCEFSADSKMILSTGENGKAFLCDINGNILKDFSFNNKITKAEFSPKGDQLMFLLSDGTLILWTVPIPYEQFKANDNYYHLSIHDSVYYEIASFEEIENKIEKKDYKFVKCFFQNYSENLLSGVQDIQNIRYKVKNMQKLGELVVTKFENDQLRSFSRLLSGISWRLIETNCFKESLEFSKLAEKADPKETFIYANLALGYLLTDDWANAKKIYLKWKDDKFTKDNIEWLMSKAYVQDIEDLEALGITHPDFAKVRELFKKDSLNKSKTK